MDFFCNIDWTLVAIGRLFGIKRGPIDILAWIIILKLFFEQSLAYATANLL
jgi:hypothetical protein